MPDPNPEPGVIESAYESQITTLYRNLVGCLTDAGGALTPAEEQQCLGHFTAGLKLARRARELALSATATESAADVAAPRQTRAASPRGAKKAK